MQIVPYLRQLAGSVISSRKQLLERSFVLPSQHLEREVLVDVYRPAVPPWRLLRLALFNDGQDLPKMRLKRKLRRLYAAGELPPTIVVGVHAGDRMREYGTAATRDHEGRGDLAPAYERFIIDELVPYLEDRFNIYHNPGKRAVAGFSLGGLSAFDLAWRNPAVFGVAGVFSGSLWYRSRPFRAEAPDADRIVHDYVRRLKKARPIRAWFMAGTADEESDRNQNGIIDAIDDTLQLVDLLRDRGRDPERDLAYVQVEGGRHEPGTWGSVIGDFLRWI